jgi:hypothetical protein
MDGDKTEAPQFRKFLLEHLAVSESDLVEGE